MSENGSFEDRLKPALLRSLVGFWSDVDEVRQRAGINAIRKCPSAPLNVEGGDK